MNKFITTYKWISLPVVLCSATVLSTSSFAVPSSSQQYKDAQQTSRVSQQYVGGNTQIGAGISDRGNIDIELNQILSENENRSTSGGIWAEYDLKGDDKGFQGRGVEINHNWVSRDDQGRALRINKAKAAYDRNASGHDKVTIGYGQEVENRFWEGRLSKGLSGRKDTRNTGSDTISDRAYEYGVGASIGKFLPNSNVRIRGGLDHEWSSKVGNNEKDAQNTTLSAGVEKFYKGTGHSFSFDVSGSKRSGGYDNGGSSDKDYSARLGYKYDFAGSNAFQNATTTRRIRVEVPGNAVAPRYESRTQYKKVPTYKTVPVYGKKVVKVPYKRMVKSTMGLEGQTFFKYGSSKLIPSAQTRLKQIAHEIRKSGYKGSIRITGNTCGLKNERNDQILSNNRAQSVRNFLIKEGFNPDHLLARGLGKGHAKYKHIPKGGFKNRRVDIEYVAETTIAKTDYRTEEKTVQTGTRKVAAGFKNVPAGTKNVLIDNGRKGSPRVTWRTETINNTPAWIKRGLHNNIKHDRSINTYQTTEGFDTPIPRNLAPVATNDSVKTACGIPVNIDVLGNDTDQDGNPLQVVSFTQGSNGTVTQGSNGQLIYTSNSANCGLDDQFTYTVSDGLGGTDTATVTVTVDPDDTVVAENETTTVESGQQITIDVLSNDDSDATIQKIVNPPQNGTATIVNGQIVYIPNADFSGTDTFTYEVVDANGNTDIATVTINVAAQANTAPTATDDQSSTVAGQPVTLDSLANDGDPNNDNLVIQSVSDPANGTAVISGGQIIYTPDPGFVGIDTFTYVIADGNGGTATATETVVVSAPTTTPNQAPVARDDVGNVACSGPVTINVLGNDTDADSSNLSILNFTQPANGTVTRNASGQLIYTSNGSSCGTDDEFTYTVTDGTNTSNSATVTLSIAPAVNTAPEANDDAATTQVNQPITIMTVANDTDADSDVLTITNVSQPQNGTVTNDGTKITYTPNPDFVGVDVFDYTISDGNGGTSMATETVTVTAAPNKAPTANDDSVTTAEETPVVIMTIANDTDPDGDALAITSISQPANGTATSDGQKITYTPNPGFTGVDNITYIISDGRGGTATATETITVTAAPNIKPNAVDDSMTTQEGTPVTLMTVANDSDADGDNLTITNVNNPANGTAVISSDGKKITYTPNAGFTGVDVFDYTISDGNGGTAMATETVTVTAAPNTKPKAVDDSTSTQEGTPVTLMTVANDSDADGDNLTITNVNNPANGSAVVSADGKKITYTPNAGFTGVEVFDYTISDGNGGTAMATETITVTAAPNTKPKAVDDSTSTQEGTPVTLMTVANDSDADGDNLTITNVNNPANGTAVVSADGKKITYTPNAGFTGVEVFDYTISDGNGGTAMATETITVTAAPNTKPKAVDDSTTTQEGTPVTLMTVANDSDVDGDNLTITNVNNPANGTAVVSADGKKITYTPNAGFTGVEVFDYTISDGNGGTAMATETITVTAAPNNKPKAVDDSASTFETTPVTLMTVANDSDPDGDNLVITNVNDPANGTAVISADGKKITYTPDSGFTGVDSFDYTISDGNGGTATATETITVKSLDDKIGTGNDRVTIHKDTSVNINVLLNDSGQGLTITAVDNPPNGSVTTNNGVITYTPDPGFVGQDEFFYDVIDQTGETDAAMVIVTVVEPSSKN